MTYTITLPGVARWPDLSRAEAITLMHERGLGIYTAHEVLIEANRQGSTFYDGMEVTANEEAT